LRWLTDIDSDLRYAARALRRTPSFTAAAILTFALGVGSIAAIFSLVYGVLVRPLPYRHPETLVVIQSRDRLTGRVSPSGFSAPDLADWTERTHTFESLALCSRDVFALETSTGFTSVNGAHVSAQFFAMLGVPMALGRPLFEAGAPEIVISDRLWRNSFARDPSVVGRRVQLNSQPYTIVGVAGPAFQLPLDAQRSAGAPPQAPGLWAPMALAPEVNNRRQRSYQFIGRLEDRVTLAQARVDAEAAAQSIATEYAPLGQDATPVVIPLSDELTGAVRPVLLMWLGAVGVVWLVACANVTNLMLARQSSRAHEIAIRLALGASRRRLAVYVLAEAVLLSLAGGIVGAWLATAAVAAVRWLEPAGLPRLDAIQINLPVLAFIVITSLMAALLSAAAPLVQLSVHDGTRRMLTATVGRVTARLRSVVVVSELALSLTLLVGAVLLGRSFVNLLRTDMGAVRDHVVTVELNLAMGRTLSPAQQLALTNRLTTRVASLPDMVAVGAANGLPPNRTRMSFEFDMGDGREGGGSTRRFGLVNPTPDYFRTLGLPLLSGRVFSPADGPTAPRVVIASAGAARELFGTLDVVGRSLPIGPKRGPVPIVGIVGDVKYGGLEADARATLYLPFAQYPFRNMTLVARTSGDPRAMAAPVERAIHAVDREITLGPVRALDDVVSEAIAQPRFRTAVLFVMAGLALLLAAIGVYGVMSYAVSQRTTEIGVRLALGATDGWVIGMIVREGLMLGVTGTAGGMVGAWALTRTLARFLFGVTPMDSLSLAGAMTALIVITVLASYVPARRAALVNPVAALRAL
jgi:predicted permease